jgi:hypothetical protein
MLPVAKIPPGHAEAAIPDHQQLRAKARQLRVRLSAPPPAPGTRLRWLAHLCVELNEFADMLAEHFEYEETDGEFHELTATRPELRPRIEQLGNQHRSILASLDVECRNLSETPTSAIAAKIIAILDRFEAHERAENELLHDAINDPPGNAD